MFKLSAEEFAQALTAKDAVSSRTSCNHILVWECIGMLGWVVSHVCVLRIDREYLVSFPDSLPHSPHGMDPGYEAREYPQVAS